MKTIVFAGSLALLGTLLGTRLAIRVLVRKGYGQLIRDDGPTSHHVKRGTPTMGGLVIIAAVLVAYFGSHLLTWTLPSASAVLVLFLFTGLGVVGFLDDYIKISKQRSLGLRSKAKIAGQSIVAIIFALLSLQFPDERGVTPASSAISFLRDIAWLDGLPVVLVVLWVMLLIASASNGVNLTDGLDGLAAGACVMIFGAYALINIWQYNQSCAYTASAGPKCYEVRDPYDLAVVAIALAGACFGFLWWNAEPAKIFMGDTGSLSLGGALAGMAIFTRTELLLVILGGLFVAVTRSVVIQVAFFRATRRRVFRMAPLHHHFELAGWTENTVIVRFWLVTGMAVAFGLGLFYADWLSFAGL